MNVYVKFALSVAAYFLLMSFFCFWPSSGTASNYMGNVERVHAVDARPPQIAVKTRTDPEVAQKVPTNKNKNRKKK